MSFMNLRKIEKLRQSNILNFNFFVNWENLGRTAQGKYF